jgi:MHS family proline/betaine transporter-like MFS transporter
MLRIAALNVFLAVGFYTAFVYLVTYMEKVVHLTPETALNLNTLNMFLLLGTLVAAGALSDWLGRKPILLAATLGGVVLSLPLFWLTDHPNAGLALLGQMGFVVLIGAFGGVIPTTMVEAFPARVRCSAVSIGYNLSLGILGGTTPMVATWLIDETRDPLAPAYYVAAAAAVSLVVVIGLPGKAAQQVGVTSA